MARLLWRFPVRVCSAAGTSSGPATTAVHARRRARRELPAFWQVQAKQEGPWRPSHGQHGKGWQGSGHPPAEPVPCQAGLPPRQGAKVVHSWQEGGQDFSASRARAGLLRTAATCHTAWLNRRRGIRGHCHAGNPWAMGRPGIVPLSAEAGCACAGLARSTWFPAFQAGAAILIIELATTASDQPLEVARAGMCAV